jgi:hypothetical protein
MKQIAFSIRLYSFYMMGMGLCLLFIPNQIIGIFGFAPSHDMWIRMLGMLSVVAGGYYFYCSYFDVLPFFRITVVGRYMFAAGEVLFVLLDFAPLPLLLFAVVEGVGAAFTHYALHKAGHTKLV